MKKIVALFFIALLFISSTAYSQSNLGILKKASETNEIVSGYLNYRLKGYSENGVAVYDETEFRLKSDRFLYVLKGSKSEGSTKDVKLLFPPELLEKARSLVGENVSLQGVLTCEGNWVNVFCKMVVSDIESTEFFCCKKCEDDCDEDFYMCREGCQSRFLLRPDKIEECVYICERWRGHNIGSCQRSCPRNCNEYKKLRR